MDTSGYIGIINHEGIVRSNNNKSVVVSILASTACSGCHAQDSCNVTGSEEKIIEIYGRYNVSKGDKVTVLMKQSMGYAALLYGYLFPLVSVVAVLITMITLNVNELLSGLISVFMLVPYYSVLFLFRKKINNKFNFTLKV